MPKQPPSSALPPGQSLEDRAIVWLRLLRIPAHFTVPGDVLAGLALAGGIRAVPLPALAGTMLVSLLLYAAGMLLNDWCDREIDARERPSRPIPAGDVEPKSVRQAGLLCLGAAVGLAWLLGAAVAAVTIPLAVLVVLYNGWAKRRRWAGVLTLAGCRGLNLLLGTALALTHLGSWATINFAVLAALVLGAYIVVVSLIAADETVRLPAPRLIGCLAVTPLLLLLPAVNGLGGAGCVGVWIVWVLATANTAVLVVELRRLKQLGQVAPLVGWLLRHLIFMQAFWIAAGGATCPWIIGVILLWPLSAGASHWFYSS